MTAWLGFFWLLFLSALVAWAASAGAAVVLSRLVAQRTRRPEACARRSLMIASLPWVVPFTIVTAILLLSAAKSWGVIADHCLFHGLGHPHLCLTHLPAVPLSRLHLLGGTAALTLVLVLVARNIIGERRMAARLRSIRRLAHGFGRLRVLETHHCLALAADPRNPFILVSRGLVERLTRRERRIVVAHEVAHLRHRDLLRNHLFDLLLLAHLPWGARSLRRSWRQALEERADDRVAALYGRESVAQTLVKIVRASSRRDSSCDWARAFSAAGADPLRRIERLLSADDAPLTLPIFESLFITVLLALAIAVPAAHHALETFLGFLTGG